MVTWAELESAAPEIAAAGRKLLYQSGVGLAIWPPCEKTALHACIRFVRLSWKTWRLFSLIGPTHKRADLHRDGRYALHTFPCRDVDDEFLVMGRAKSYRRPSHRGCGA